MKTSIFAALLLSLSTLAGFTVAAELSPPNYTRDAATSWDDLPAVLARIKAPTFPDRDFDIRDYGAKPAGKDLDNTAAIHRAIAACHDAGGGRVVVPAGTWPTGAIHLQSNVNLHVSEGATLLFSSDPAKYPLVHTTWEGVELMNYSPLIYAFEQKNVALTGRGTLDGQASYENWWDWKNYEKGPPFRQVPDREKHMDNTPVEERVFGEGHLLRPSFVQPYRCENVLIEGVTILRAPFWVVHPVQSTNVTVRGVTVESAGPNNDGCDPEACRDVLIEDCTFKTGDDCIAIKSGRNEDARRIGFAAENIVIRNCHFSDGHGGVVIGSEISGGCQNVFVENSVMDSPHLGRALRFKNNAMRGAVIENIFLRNISVKRVGNAVIAVQNNYEEGDEGPFTPVLRNVQVDNLTCADTPRVLHLASYPGAVLEDIVISNSTFLGVKKPDLLQHGSARYESVTITPAN